MAVAERADPRFLIVRRDNIGDLVCTTPLLDGLRARYPRAWIGALVNTYNAEVLARNPAIDEVFAYEKLKHRTGSLFANLAGRWRLQRRLRAARLDAVLVPSPSPRALRVAAALKSREVISGHETAHTHEVERTFALAASLGVQGGPGPMRVYPNADKVADVRKLLVGREAPVAVHISARRPAQRWPLERYAQLIAEFAKSSPVMLLWAPGSSDDARHPGDDDAARNISLPPNAIAVPTPDLATLIAALSLSKSVVCPDGGAMHLAAALGKSVLALFGDSPVERWRPWGVPYQVVQPASRNLADLPLGHVLEGYAALAEEGRD